MISKDFVFDENDDLKIVNGDWAIEQSDDQNIEAIILAEKGQFYETLLLGYGIYRRQYGPFKKNQERKDIRQELKRDNYDVVSLIIDDNFNIDVDANKVK
jgi:hypothetical protein